MQKKEFLESSCSGKFSSSCLTGLRAADPMSL